MADRIILHEHVITRKMSEELVLLDLKRGTYFGLDEIGAVIWDRLSQGEDTDAIAEHLAQMYEVSPVQARVDISELLSLLVENGLVGKAVH